MADPLTLYRDVPDDPRLGSLMLRPVPQPGALGAFARRFARSAAPTAGGVATFGVGAEFGGAAGLAVGGPIGGAVGGLLGGLTTSVGGSALVERAQNWLLDHLDPETVKALGQDQATLAADEAAHPWASFAGSVLPQAAFFRPGFGGVRALAGGAAVGGAVEAGSELADTGKIDPFKVVTQAAAGALLNKPTRLGTATLAPGERMARTIAQGEGVTLPLAQAHEELADIAPGTHPDDWTADQAAAAHVIDDHEFVARGNPFAATGAGAEGHGARLAEATRAAAAGRAPDFGAMAAPADRYTAAKARIAHFESRGDYGARSPLSSASGRYQFLDSTWLGHDGQGGFARLAFPGRTDAELLALKRDPAAQEAVMDVALRSYDAQLRRAGIEPSAGALYALHFLGPKGIKLLKAPHDTPVSAIASEAEIAANKRLLEGKTTGEVVAELNRKMNDPAAGAPHIEEAEAVAGAAPEAFEAMPELRARADGPFGPVHGDVAADWTAGLARLRAAGGEVPAAFDHPEIGPIDAVWGRPGKDGYGIAHVESEHPEVLDDLPAIIGAMAPAERQANARRVQLESRDHRASISLDWHGEEKRWLLTAYRRDENGRPVRTPTAADDGRAGDGAQDGSPARGVDDDVGQAAQADKVEAVWSPLGGYDAFDAAGERLVPADHEAGALPKRWGSPEAVAQAAPRLTRLRDIERAARPESGEAAAAYLGRFDDPESAQAGMATETIEHDLRMAIEADPALTVRLDAEGDVINLADLLAGFDDEMRANEAVQACLAPKGAA